MAWTDPRTWTADQLVRAADFNEQIRDNMLILKVAVSDAGKIPEISSTYFDDLDGSEITGLVHTDTDNVLTGKNSFTGAGRLVVPVGADKWATP